MEQNQNFNSWYQKYSSYLHLMHRNQFYIKLIWPIIFLVVSCLFNFGWLMHPNKMVVYYSVSMIGCGLSSIAYLIIYLMIKNDHLKYKDDLFSEFKLVYDFIDQTTSNGLFLVIRDDKSVMISFQHSDWKLNWFNSFGVAYWCLFIIIVGLTTGLFVMQYLK